MSAMAEKYHEGTQIMTNMASFKKAIYGITIFRDQRPPNGAFPYGIIRVGLYVANEEIERRTNDIAKANGGSWLESWQRSGNRETRFESIQSYIFS